LKVFTARDEAMRERAKAAVSADSLRRLLAASGVATLRIHSDSMRPIARSGTLVALRSAAPDERLRGAVVAMDAGERVIVHRAVRASAAWVTTRGIASRHADPPWPRDRVIGVVSTAGRWKSERALRWAAAVASITYRIYRLVPPPWGTSKCGKSVRSRGNVAARDLAEEGAR
jgi:hypothetical protein